MRSVFPYPSLRRGGPQADHSKSIRKLSNCTARLCSQGEPAGSRRASRPPSATIREATTAPQADAGREVREAKQRLREIERKADELPEMMTPAHREFVDEKLTPMRREREALEARLAELQARQCPDVVPKRWPGR